MGRKGGLAILASMTFQVTIPKLPPYDEQALMCVIDLSWHSFFDRKCFLSSSESIPDKNWSEIKEFIVNVSWIFPNVYWHSPAHENEWND